MNQLIYRSFRFFILCSYRKVSKVKNDPPRVEISKLISLFAKKKKPDMTDILNKCHTDPRFIFMIIFLFILLGPVQTSNFTCAESNYQFRQM